MIRTNSSTQISGFHIWRNADKAYLWNNDFYLDDKEFYVIVYRFHRFLFDFKNVNFYSLLGNMENEKPKVINFSIFWDFKIIFCQTIKSTDPNFLQTITTFFKKVLPSSFNFIKQRLSLFWITGFYFIEFQVFHSFLFQG